MSRIPSTPVGSNQQLNGIVSSIPMPRGPAPTLSDGSPFTLAVNNQVSLGGAIDDGFTIVNNGGSGGNGSVVVDPSATGGGSAAAPTNTALGSTTSSASTAAATGGGTTPAAGSQPPAPTDLGAATPGTAPSGTAPGSANAPATPVSGSTPATGTTPVTAPTTTTPTAGTAATQAVSGFGKAERGKEMVVSVDGASFSFPSFKASAKSDKAPAITWSPEWKRVEAGGMWYMQNAKGSKAIPAVEFRVTPSPAEKVQTVKVANGWGKKFPDGTIVVFDRNEGAYRLDAKGEKHKVPLGTHTFGGVKVRVFEVSVVRTLEQDGKVTVFDSRGQASAGTKRSRLSAALGAANAGASASGGGKTSTGGATGSPSDGSGGKVPGTTVAAGGAAGAAAPLTTAQLTQNVQKLTGVARGLIAEINSGSVDPVRLAELQAQLGTLPAGILQAAGAAGTMTSDGRGLRHAGEDHATTGATTSAVAGASGAGSASGSASAPTPGAAGAASGGTTAATTGSGTTTPPAAGTTTPPGTTTATAGGGGGAAATTNQPVAGVDANATSKALTAGAKAKLTESVPAELSGKQARFAQLPEQVQLAVAKAFGSDQGQAAFKADQLVAFNASGEVTLVEPGTVYTKHQQLIRGAGPGEDLALTVRPARQPGSTGSFAANPGVASTTATGSGATTRPGATSGGGTSVPAPAAGGTSAGSTNSGAGTGSTAGSSGANGGTRPVGGAPTISTVNGGGTNLPTIKLFATGASMRHVDLGGINGSFTWKTLPAKARAAILDFLRTSTTDPAAKAYASRTGSGWSFDPNAVIVVDAGTASFVGGLSMSRGATTALPNTAPAPVSGGGGTGATTQPVGHDATHPPVSGGGASRPGTSGGSGGTAGRPPITGGGATAPGTAPPIPGIADPGEHAGMVM